MYRRRPRRLCGNIDCQNPSVKTWTYSFQDQRLKVYGQISYCSRDCAEVDIRRHVRRDVIGDYPNNSNQRRRRRENF